MAKRIATLYVKACLQLSEVELMKWLETWVEHQIIPQIKVLDNGNQGLVFWDEVQDEEITILIERIGDQYVLSGGFQFASRKVADLLRQAISQYKGDAVVQRIFVGFTMEYHYIRGHVVKIVEKTERKQRIIFEFRNGVTKLNQTFYNDKVEREIARIRTVIDKLLDQRNKLDDEVAIAYVDNSLRKCSERLFVLEA